MSESNRTLAYVGVAGVLFLAAFVVPAASRTTPGEFTDQGELFFPEFTDFTQATSLEVWEPDEPLPFKVEFKDGVWRIPSKDNYPADAENQLGKTAADVMALERTLIVSRREQDHASLGVLDPQATDATDGVGTRVTIRDPSDRVLADLILGKEAEDKAGFRYLRRADEKRTYAAKADLSLSTQFSKWIETDPLDFDVARVTSITIDKYQVDETMLRQGAIRILPGEKVVVGKDDAAEWVLGDQGPDEAVSTAAVNSLTDTLRELQIADVLKRDRARMEQVGFFVTQDGQVYSNEGELRIDHQDGVQLVLRFGEIAPGREQQDKLERFVVIDADFNPTAMDAPDDAEKRKEAQEKVRELKLRFGEWYYVITADSFDGLRPSRSALARQKSAEEEDERGEGDGHDHGGAPFPPVGPPAAPDDPHDHDHGD